MIFLRTVILVSSCHICTALRLIHIHVYCAPLAINTYELPRSHASNGWGMVSRILLASVFLLVMASLGVFPVCKQGWRHSGFSLRWNRCAFNPVKTVDTITAETFMVSPLPTRHWYRSACHQRLFDRHHRDNRLLFEDFMARRWLYNCCLIL